MVLFEEFFNDCFINCKGKIKSTFSSLLPARYGQVAKLHPTGQGGECVKVPMTPLDGTASLPPLPPVWGLQAHEPTSWPSRSHLPYTEALQKASITVASHQSWWREHPNFFPVRQKQTLLTARTVIWRFCYLPSNLTLMILFSSRLTPQALVLYLAPFILLPLCAQSLKSCLTLCNPMVCSLPDSSVHGILQARILEWVARPSSRVSSWPRDWNPISYVSCVGGWVLYH